MKQSKKTILSMILMSVLFLSACSQPKEAPQQNPQGKCGDGFCDAREKANPQLCPKDCPQEDQKPKTQTPAPAPIPSPAPIGSPAPSPNPSEPRTEEQVSLDSPFGMHPAQIISGRQISFSDAEYIGVKWHRPSIYMFWFKVQSSLDSQNYDFSFYDEYYGSVPAGIKILGNIAPAPKTIRGYTLPGSYLPVDEGKYTAFVKAGVERYDGDEVNDMPGLKNPIRYWQVGNEPNDRGNLKDFAKFQKMTYEAIKEACPDCTVLIGGAAQPIIPNMGFVFGKEEYFKLFSEQYEPYLKELGGKYFDVFDFHWYGNARGDYRKMGPVYAELKNRLAGYGYSVPIWVTEMGSYSGGTSDSFASFQTEKEQAADYLKRFVYSLSIGVNKVFPAFGLIEGFKNNDGYFDHTGFIYDGKGTDDLGHGVKKLSYYTYKKMTETLEGSDWDNIQTIRESEGVHIYKFTKDGKNIWVAWNDNPAPQKVLIPLEKSTKAVKITEAVPKYETGKEVNDYNTAFNETTTAGLLEGYPPILSLDLKDVPIFIEGE